MNEKAELILDVKFGFGKFRNKTLKEVLELSPSYLNWCMLNIDFVIPTEYIDALNEAGVDLHLSKQALKKNKENEDVILAKMEEEALDNLELEKDREEDRKAQDLLDQQKPGYWDLKEGNWYDFIDDYESRFGW